MDLNLLRVFVSIYETGNLTETSRKLFVTQPSVSYALSRLRKELNDPLFIRSNRRMSPTPLARQLHPTFEASLRDIDRSIAEITDYDPTVSTRMFQVCLSDAGELAFLPAILKRFETIAPAVQFNIVPMDITAVEEWLARGTVDIAIASSVLDPVLERRALLREGYSCVLAADVHVDANRLLPEDLLGMARVSVGSTTGHDRLEVALASAGLGAGPRVIVQHFSVVPPLLVGSRRFAIVPHTIAMGWVDQWPLHAVALDFELPQTDVYLYFSRSEQSAVSWFQHEVWQALHDSPVSTVPVAKTGAVLPGRSDG